MAESQAISWPFHSHIKVEKLSLKKMFFSVFKKSQLKFKDYFVFLKLIMLPSTHYIYINNFLQI